MAENKPEIKKYFSRSSKGKDTDIEADYNDDFDFDWDAFNTCKKQTVENDEPSKADKEEKSEPQIEALNDATLLLNIDAMVEESTTTDDEMHYEVDELPKSNEQTANDVSIDEVSNEASTEEVADDMPNTEVGEDVANTNTSENTSIDELPTLSEQIADDVPTDKVEEVVASEDNKEETSADKPPIEVLSEEVEVLEEPPVPKEYIKKRRSKLAVRIIISFVVVLGLLVGAYFMFFVERIPSYDVLSDITQTLTNESVELTFSGMEFITNDLRDANLDENYVYIGVNYSIKNISEVALEWESFPYLEVKKYTLEEDKYIVVEGSEAEFDYHVLQLYAMGQELDFTDASSPLEVGETRQDADVIKILKSDFESNNYCFTFDNLEYIVDVTKGE